MTKITNSKILNKELIRRGHNVKLKPLLINIPYTYEGYQKIGGPWYLWFRLCSPPPQPNPTPTIAPMDQIYIYLNITWLWQLFVYNPRSVYKKLRENLNVAVERLPHAAELDFLLFFFLFFSYCCCRFCG